MKISSVFDSLDTVFHYTKLNTALECILYDKKLRLFPRRNAHDPIEKIKPGISAGGVFGEKDERPEMLREKHADTIDKLTRLVRESIDSCKQVCFCMNNDDEKYQYVTMKPYEFYGFLKPRMWDQYADNYKGVCLAFSLSELQKNKGLFHDKIKYIDYGNFIFKDHHIDLNGLALKGDDIYSKEYIERFNKMLFNKHVDYSGENEYRFCKFNGEAHYDIDISNSLRGIIISENYTSDFAQNALLKYARDIDIELIKINWTSSGFHLSNKQQIESLLRLIEGITNS